MSTLAGIGSVLSGIGSIAGAFSGDDGASLGKQLRYRWNDLAQAPKYQVQGARAAGLHPLFAMGAGMGQSPSFAISGQGRSQFADAMSAAGSAVEGFSKVKLQDAALAESEARAYKATAEGVLADAQAGQVLHQMNAAAEAKARQSQSSARDKVFQSHVWVKDFDGSLYRVPNPEVYELPETIGAYEYARGRAMNGPGYQYRPPGGDDVSP